jgi:cyclase
MDISLTDYSSWGDAERIVVNIDCLYREFSGDTSDADVASRFEMMAQIRRDRFSAS